MGLKNLNRETVEKETNLLAVQCMNVDTEFVFDGNEFKKFHIAWEANTGQYKWKILCDLPVTWPLGFSCPDLIFDRFCSSPV